MTEPGATHRGPEPDSTDIDDPYARPADAGAYVGNRAGASGRDDPGWRSSRRRADRRAFHPTPARPG